MGTTSRVLSVTGIRRTICIVLLWSVSSGNSAIAQESETASVDAATNVQTPELSQTPTADKSDESNTDDALSKRETETPSVDQSGDQLGDQPGNHGADNGGDDISDTASSDGNGDVDDSLAITTDMQTDATPPNDDLVAGDYTTDKMLELGLEELLNTPVEVWTATKTKTTLDEAPAIITVITREDILRYGYRSVADALNHVSGFYVIDDHILPNLAIRGVAGSMNSESGNIKVLVDGVNMAFRSTGGNWLGPELIPISIIKRIEIIRGPASALYGADAFLGVVNIITVSGEDISGASTTIGGGYMMPQNKSINFDFAGGGQKKNFEIVIGGRIHREDRDGLKLPDTSPNPRLVSYNRSDSEDFNIASHNMYQKSNVVYAQLGYRFNDHFKLELVGSGAQITRGGEFSTWSQMTSGLDTLGRERGTTVELNKAMTGLLATITPNDDLTIEYRASYQTGQPTRHDKIDVGSDLYFVRRDFGYKVVDTSLEGRWRIREDFSAIVAGEFTFDREKLPSSLRVLRASVNDLNAGEVMEDSSTRQNSQNLYNIGALAQGMWTGLAPYLSLTGGIRFDNHSLYGNQLSGRAGIISEPIEKLHFKLLYGSAFKAPSPLLLYGVPHDVGDIFGNPDLKPQKVHTWEAQATLKPSKFFSVSTGAAYSLLKDKATFVQRGINRVAANISEMNTLSWETEAAFMYNEWIRANVGFEYVWVKQKSQNVNSVYLDYLMGENNEIYPAYIGRLAISGQIPHIPLQLGTTLMLVGERPSSAMNALENQERYELPTYVMWNASISTIGIEFIEEKETVFSVSGYNLLNQDVADPGYAGIDYPIKPISILVQMTQQF